MSWIQTAYLIAEVIAIPLTGFLTRLLSMRWLFVLSSPVFTLASVGCAASGNFSDADRLARVSGLFRRYPDPRVFSAVFLLFPVALQGLATTFAGVLAVLAPTVGPVVGGWITQTYTWHWLFLINVVPGIVSAVAPASCCRGAEAVGEARTLDVLSLAFMAIGARGAGNRAEGSADSRLDFRPVADLLALSVASWSASSANA